MRRLPKLIEPSHIEKKFVIKDFSKYTEQSEGVSFSGEGLTCKKTYPVQSVVSFNEGQASKLYKVNGKLFAYLTDGRILLSNGCSWQQIGASSVEPAIISLEIEGSLKTLLICDGCYFVDNAGNLQAVNLPYGKCAVAYKNMLFIANGNNIAFSRVGAFTDFTSGLDSSGFISTDIESGEVLALFPTKSYLVVVCERAIYHLKPVGERADYQLIKQDVALNVKRNSPQAVGDDIYLFDGNAFCRYNNNAFYKIDCAINGKYTFDGQSCVYGNFYYSTIIDLAGNSYLYAYNGVTGEEIIMEGEVVLGDDGLFVAGGSVKRFSSSPAQSQEIRWESVELDFDSPLRKTLLGVEVRASAPVAIRLSCAYANKTLEFASGLNLIKTNLTDKAFKINVHSSGRDAKVHEIRFNYRLQEE